MSQSTQLCGYRGCDYPIRLWGEGWAHVGTKGAARDHTARPRRTDPAQQGVTDRDKAEA